MPSYLITGASRGLGFEFLSQLSADGSNTVFGLVRNKEATDEKIRSELGVRTNVHIIKADLSDYGSLQNAVPAVSAITGGSLDYLIANAALVSSETSYRTFGSVGKTPDVLEKDLLDNFKINVVGNVHLFNLFVPLVLRGEAKKVITISSGHADLESIARYDIDISGSYAATKGAMNIVVAKYSAEYRKEGVLFLSLSPGVVDTNKSYGEVTEEVQANMQTTFAKFANYAPGFRGPATPESAVKDCLDVIYRAGVNRGDAGAFISHFGNKQWL